MTAILEPQTVETVPEPAVRPEPARTVAPPRVVEPRRVVTRPVLTPRGLRIFAAVLIGLFVVAVAVQPAPDGPQPVAPMWANVLNGVIQIGLLAILAGALMGRRWTAWAGLATGASMLTLSISCPIDGHHQLAAWWFVQMAVAVAMTVLPAGVLRRTQASPNAG